MKNSGNGGSKKANVYKNPSKQSFYDEWLGKLWYELNKNPVISFNAFDELIQEILLASEQSSQCKGVQQFEIAFCQHFNELQDIR